MFDMAIPEAVMRRLSWAKLHPKIKRTTRSAMEQWMRYRKRKGQIREIGVLRGRLGVTSKSLKEHAKWLVEKENVPEEQLFERVIGDLQMMEGLLEKLPRIKAEDITLALNGTMKHPKMSIAQVIEKLEGFVEEEGAVPMQGQVRRKAA